MSKTQEHTFKITHVFQYMFLRSIQVSFPKFEKIRGFKPSCVSPPEKDNLSHKDIHHDGINLDIFKLGYIIDSDMNINKVSV